MNVSKWESPKIFLLCQTGGKKLENRFVNEDKVFYGHEYACLMDGATGLGDLKSINGLTTAEWYVEIIADFLKKNLPNKYKETKQIIVDAIAYATEQIKRYEKENNIKFESYEEPSSSLVLVRKVKKDEVEYLNILVLGDSSIAIKYKDGTVKDIDNLNKEALSALDNSVLNRMKELSIAENKDFLDVIQYDEIQNMLKENRSKKNNLDGYWVLGTSKDAVDHAAYYVVPKEDVEQIIMYSDGFNYEVLAMQIDEVLSLCQTQTELEDVCLKIRETEEKDAKANQYPRFKKHDDMSVLVISYN